MTVLALTLSQVVLRVRPPLPREVNGDRRFKQICSFQGSDSITVGSRISIILPPYILPPTPSRSGDSAADAEGAYSRTCRCRRTWRRWRTRRRPETSRATPSRSIRSTHRTGLVPHPSSLLYRQHQPPAEVLTRPPPLLVQQPGERLQQYRQGCCPLLAQRIQRDDHSLRPDRHGQDIHHGGGTRSIAALSHAPLLFFPPTLASPGGLPASAGPGLTGFR